MLNIVKQLHQVLILVIFNTLLMKTFSKITGHLLIHSHQDPGWVRTFENIYQETSKKVFQTTIECLYSDLTYRLNWAEQIFLDRWWHDKDVYQTLKDKFLEIVKRGQVQFVHPGMVQADEAMVSFAEAMDNYQLGQHFLEDVFGVRPHVSWALDPFGQSAYTPALMQHFGLDTIYSSSISGFRKDILEDSGMQFFIWEGHPVNGQPSKVLTITTSFGNYSPSNIAYDERRKDSLCSYEDLFDKPPIKCMQAFYNESMRMYIEPNNKIYDTENFPIAILIGDDGAFQNAYYNFHYLDKLIQVFRDYSASALGYEIELRYSTFDEYLLDLNSQGFEIPLYRGDFFPEIENDGQTNENLQYWNGFYSNRPVYKTLVRQMFQQVHQTQAFLAFIQSMSFYETGDFSSRVGMKLLESELAGIINLHHDAVTGTHTVNVNYDYVDKTIKSQQFAKEQAQTLSFVLNEMHNKADTKILEQSLLSNLEYLTHKVVTVFNPNIKSSVNEVINMTVESNKYYFAVDENLNSLPLQVLPLTSFDQSEKQIYFNDTHSNLHVLIPFVHPFSAMKVMVFNFDREKDCSKLKQQLIEETQKQNQKCFQASIVKKDVLNAKEDPEISYSSGTEDIKLILNKSTGFIQQLRQNGVEENFDQTVIAYVGWEHSNSGFYLFDPNRRPKKFRDLFVRNIYSYDGPIFSCLHSIVTKEYTFNTIENAYFENRVCILKHHLERVLQQVKAKSIYDLEIVLKTRILPPKNQNKAGLQYYSHDSLYGVERNLYSESKAIEKHLIKSIQEKELQNYTEEQAIWDANSYPCNSGLIVEDIKKQIALGFSYQHGLLCQFPSREVWYLMLTRATQNPRFQQGIHDQQDDFDYTTFDMTFTMGDIQDDKNFSLFIDTMNQLDFNQNFGLLTVVEQLSAQNVQQMSILPRVIEEIKHLKLIKVQFEEHEESFSFTVQNNHDYAVQIEQFDIEDQKYEIQILKDGGSSMDLEVNMLVDLKEGSYLNPAFQIYEYKIFELNHKNFSDLAISTDDYTIPPLSIATIRFARKDRQLKEERVNHFNSEERTYYWSQSKYVRKELTHVTCFSSLGVIGGIVFYFSCCFLVYSVFYHFKHPALQGNCKRRR